MMAKRPKINLEQGLEIIQQGIAKYKNSLDRPTDHIKFTSTDYMTLYDTVYCMCTQQLPYGYSRQLYDKYRELIQEHIITSSNVLPSLREEEENGEFMLTELVRVWEDHRVMARRFYGFFHYLDHFYTPRKKLAPLDQVGMACFRDLVLNEVKGNVKSIVISLIGQDREGEEINRALLKNVLDIFVEVGLGSLKYYECEFEADMLNDASAYYSRRASNWIRNDSFPNYMLKAEECLKQEMERVAHYLHPSSEPKLLEKVQNELLSAYANRLLENEFSGCIALLRDDKVDDLSRMYQLFSKIPDGLQLVSEMFRQHVIEGLTNFKQAEDAACNMKGEKGYMDGLQEWVFVRQVLELHKHLDYVKNCFQSHSLFCQALKEAFIAICDKSVTGSLGAKLLATFFHKLLKNGGSEKLSDEDLETLLKVINMLPYISDIDLFSEFYRKDLARRLLLDKIDNYEKERRILIELKLKCGHQYTVKMEGMITDITLSRKNQTDFEEYINSDTGTTTGVALSVAVLTSGFWPSYKTSTLSLPAEMTKCLQVFEDYYHKKSKKKTLTWIYSLGTCNVLGMFDAKNIELIVTPYQAAVLLLFNDSDCLSYSEILARLNLPDEDGARLLASLSGGEYKILNIVISKRSSRQNDRFEFNAEFTAKVRRIKIPPPTHVEKKVAIENVNVSEDRRYVIDASIMRIMKLRKVLDHQQLVIDCGEKVGYIFKSDSKAVKKSIEGLINREYLERDKDNPNLYRYLP